MRNGYDDHKLYNLSIDRRGFELVCAVSEIYNNTSSERLQLINFYESELGRAIYSRYSGVFCKQIWYGMINRESSVGSSKLRHKNNGNLSW